MRERNFLLLPWTLTVLLSLVISSCSEKTDNNARTHTMGNGEYRVTVIIPNEYIDFPYTSISDESGFVQAYYPGNIPLPDTYDKLSAGGRWKRNILILFTSRSKYPDHDLENTLMAFKKLYRADRETKENDLIKFDQADPKFEYKDDLWIENRSGKVDSIIKCLDEKNGPRSAQCTLYFTDQWFVYNVDFDKTLLSEWRLIRVSSNELIKSFVK